MTRCAFSEIERQILAEVAPVAKDTAPCLSPSPNGFLCTRALNHDGPHIAHGLDNGVAALWHEADQR